MARNNSEGTMSKTDKENTSLSKTDNETPVKKKWARPDLKNFGADLVEAGDNSRYIRQALVSMDLPPIDISDPKQVEKRIREYFEYCAEQDIKPRVLGMANWLGVHRDTLAKWRTGVRRAGKGNDEVMQRAMGVMEELWESYMLDGKVNTVAGIFLGKVMFGYKEPTEVVISAANPLGDQQKAPEALEEYLNTVDAD